MYSSTNSKRGEQIQMPMGANSVGNGCKFNFYGSQSDVNRPIGNVKIFYPKKSNITGCLQFPILDTNVYSDTFTITKIKRIYVSPPEIFVIILGENWHLSNMIGLEAKIL
ncbi:hypothetical protein PHYBLDRAFT_167163 [Phycomyces blakesleeanus NRRL 1555(-)]|uniref:Uncharacterized protein n=1 Tax=Phycomyces blakesleeanus (strain ATCC 8743b / DSM 1359 / FGSC 10004 / NBRC 33097 / NRRL 1555) TaxID=763407 RepID=A0A162PPN6_PHYB8|nr:hypothetical protein PHYBLDRAFT_167163 [Phycomyces blakesleeanus NRRL 1555(-)]OAD74817.1 hypothetical protein PHYBLDRAFT_167163 [Phycomyces blakesleeanus NRRL 1555(-)]|eukprot:XP_018292857.1 hypothetical protein PHYBLDRAFT_167163 [Phycomyces blakesleeanus NRRL 1555(-)]